ncbi:MAG: zinc-binding dehydrogenase, partial [Desulfosarcina sp.]|nr:zinc-binding dehydrogenase [Desulfobacterales bacterium]
KVGACGINNNEINTRVGWYSAAVTGPTTDAHEDSPAVTENGAWGGRLTFPRIQGADVVGRIVATGGGVSARRLNERVIVDPQWRDPEAPNDRTRTGYLGSEYDGGFAEYVVVPAVNAYPVASAWSDAELATFPCAYSTAEHMLTRVRVAAEDTVLITGASGGVGSALVQLAKRRGAHVVGLSKALKTATVRALGADAVVPRDTDDMAQSLAASLPGGRADVVADVVGGGIFPQLLQCLKHGGRYVSAGAIAGPLVELDLRRLYLMDLEMQGTTIMPPAIFPALVGYIERREIRPVLAAQWPLPDIHRAQTAFLEKRHTGNFVLMPAGPAC